MSFGASGVSALRFRRVGIVGVGLIGGSFALALKTVKAADTVVGFGRSRVHPLTPAACTSALPATAA